MSRVKLYGTRFSPFVEKVARGFELKRVAFDLTAPRSPGDLRRWSPQTRKMPVAEIDGERIFDSTFILRRLDEISPRPPLLSDDPAVASAQRLLEDWADESLYWLRMAILWNDRNAATTTEALISDLAPPNLFRPLMRPVLLRGMRRSTQAQGRPGHPAGRPSVLLRRPARDRRSGRVRTALIRGCSASVRVRPGPRRATAAARLAEGSRAGDGGLIPAGVTAPRRSGDTPRRPRRGPCSPPG
jgi:hypothetical protein